MRQALSSKPIFSGSRDETKSTLSDIRRDPPDCGRVGRDARHQSTPHTARVPATETLWQTLTRALECTPPGLFILEVIGLAALLFTVFAGALLVAALFGGY